MKKTIYRIICAVMALALTSGSYLSVSALAISPSTYYVSVTGNDANACTYIAPCTTFTKAMSLAQPGDTVHVLQGTYNQQLVITKSSIIVEGDGAVINTSAQNGIRVTSTAQNVTVKGFTVTGTRSHVIFIEGKFITVENNIIHDAITENGIYPNCGNGQWGSAIKAERESSNVTIQGNQVYRTCGEGIASTMSHDVVISGNTVYDNHSVNIYVDNSYNVSVTGNTIYCTKTISNPVGVALGEEFYTGWGAQLKGVAISGNVVTNCSSGIMAFTSNVGGTLTNVTISNNLIPSGQSKGVSLDNNKNLNVSIIKNTYYNQPWIRSATGVTLSGNVIGAQIGTPVPLSSIPAKTSTVPVTFTRTPVLPSATSSLTRTVTPSITRTPSSLPKSPTPTASSLPKSPTPTASSLPKSPTPTASPVPVLPTATPTFVPPTTTSQPVSEIVYDDNNSSFVYSPGWVNLYRDHAYGGSYKITAQDGSFVTLAFIGQSFSVIYAGDPSFGRMDVYVDGLLVGTIDEKMNSFTPQQRWDYSGHLALGSHTLKLVFTPKTMLSSIYGSLDAVIIR